MHAMLSALAEPNRLRIVALLRAGAQPVGEISELLQLRQPQVSKHLRVLKDAGVVDVLPVAQQRLYQLSPAPFRALHVWLEDYRQLWEARFSELDVIVKELKQQEQEGKERHDRRKK
jgi:DNA-binding transcriptional ArsR family regulator